MRTKVSIVIQARMGSTRLRGKSLMLVLGKPLLQRVIETAKLIVFADEIIVATTDLQEDNPIESLANELKVSVFRGDTLNVLDRFIHATNHLDEKDHIIRFTADNPLNWVEKSKKLFDIHLGNDNDYTCIDGLSHIVFEIVRVRSLRDSSKAHNLTPFDCEHVTSYIRKNKRIFKVIELPSDFDGLRRDLDRFMTIDTSDDLYRFENFGKSVNLDGIVDFKKLYQWLEINELKIKNEVIQKENVVYFNGVPVGDNFPTYVIAEIGQNHNGEIRIAKQLIEMAARCGADAVKFQKRDMFSELTKEAYNKPYDNPNSFGKTYGEHRTFLELNEEQHAELKDFAEASGITYFCTPCDIPSVELLERINCPFYKVASRDITNIPLLEKISSTGKSVIMSTGMANLQDIDNALNALKRGPESLVILQCTSEYPCKLENVNLKAIETLRKKYGYLVGLSDHTSGVIVSAAAVVMGAVMIEKHITLDHTMKGTDHPGSLEEQGLRKLIDYIRAVKIAMGDGVKEFNPAVAGSKDKLARSLTSKVVIKKGQIVTEDMICLKSPGTGISWIERSKILGKKSKYDIESDVTLKENDFE
jgi:sialic acid synthase